MKYILAIDLGATNLRVAIVNSNHEIVKKVKVLTDKNLDLARTIFKCYKDMKCDYKLQSIVVSVAGSIDYKQKIIRDLPNLNIKSYNLYDALYKLFKLPIEINNDASMATLAEYSLYEKERVFQYITISSGIGGGLVYEGKLFRGNNGFEQEIGRMMIKEEKFEDICSGNALKNRLLKQNIDEEYPSNALMSKNDNYVKVVDEWLDDLSIGIANIIKIINPSVIVFGGGLGSYLEYFKKGLLDRLKEELPFDIIDEVRFEVAHFGDDSALIGASYLIFQDN